MHIVVFFLLLVLIALVAYFAFHSDKPVVAVKADAVKVDVVADEAKHDVVAAADYAKHDADVAVADVQKVV